MHGDHRDACTRYGVKLLSGQSISQPTIRLGSGARHMATCPSESAGGRMDRAMMMFAGDHGHMAPFTWLTRHTVIFQGQTVARTLHMYVVDCTYRQDT